MFRKALLASVGILMIASCATKKPKPESESAAAGGAGDAPVVADKEIATDPMGSDGGKISGLNTVFFELDQSRLTSEARQQLAGNAEWIKGHPTVTIQIEGHTDERGSVEYNLSLGERRAKSVKAYLTSLGIEPRRMTIISYGEEKPLDSSGGESAWAKNRRANFVPLQ